MMGFTCRVVGRDRYAVFGIYLRGSFCHGGTKEMKAWGVNCEVGLMRYFIDLN